MNKPARGTANKRELDGLIILDKAPGLTSNKCLQQVKHLLGAAKAGHTGSLDPLASGVLPLCFGEATKISRFLLDSDKCYVAGVRLGITTDTADSEGAVTSTSEVPRFTTADIEQALQQFAGVITQLPPAYSALKQDGVPQYKLARAGKYIEPKYRDVTIHSIRLLAWAWPDLEMEVSCSKGTYIRTLAEDIGKQLGTGAHITMLRRTKAGPFTLADSVTLAQLQEMVEAPEKSVSSEQIEGASRAVLSESGTPNAMAGPESKLIAMDKAVDHLPALHISEEQTLSLRQGKHVLIDTVVVAPQIRIYCNGIFIGIAELRADRMLKATRLLKY